MTGGARAHVRIDRSVAPVSTQGLRGPNEVGLFADLATPLFLVEGNNLLWRAAHGWRAPFEASDGRDLTPLFRFITLLRRALGTYGLFSECVVCFDGAEAWSARTDVDAGYKAQRRYEDADLSFMGWLPEIRSALDCVGVASIELVQHEADDVIGTLAAHAAERPVRILSTDRDYYQLVSDTTTVVNVKSRPPLVGTAEIVDRYGVHPGQWCDLRALAGDQSDGIPGLAGVGMKRAALMLQAGPLDELRHRNAAVAEHWDELNKWRDLMRLRTDLEIGWEPTGVATPRLPSASAICTAFGLA